MPAMESLVSDISAGAGKLITIFNSVEDSVGRRKVDPRPREMELYSMTVPRMLLGIPELLQGR